MSKEKEVKEVKKQTSKKPVEKKEVKKTSKKPVEKKEIHVEPKREVKHEEVIANDMVDQDKDDKIWIVIAILLVLLVGGAFITNKFVNTKKTEESSNNKIFVSKKINTNEDGTVTVKVKVKSNVGLKSITLEDGTVMNFNNKKEVEVKFDADKNKEYTLIIKDKNDVKTKKKIKITNVKEKEVAENKDQELVVEEVVQPNYVIYYYKPQNNNEITPVVDVTPTFNIEDNYYSNKDLNVELSNNSDYTLKVKYNNNEEKLYNNEILTEEGKYVVTATNTNGNILTVNFTIDKTAPVFDNLVDGGVYTSLVSAQATDTNFKNYEVIINNYKYDQIDNPTLDNGYYTVTAYDLAGNSTSVNVTVSNIFEHNFDASSMIFNNYLSLNINEELANQLESVALYRRNDNFEYVPTEVVSNTITESGFYYLELKLNGEVSSRHFYFVIDKEAPSVNIEENEVVNGVITDASVVITDQTGLSNGEYGYNSTGNKEDIPNEKFPLPGVDEGYNMPTNDEEDYFWISVTDNAGNNTVATTDKPVQYEVN